MISQWTVVSVFNKIFNFFVSHLFVIYFLSFQLFVFSALWSSQPFELPSFLVSKLFGPPKMSLVLRPPVAWSLILRTGYSTLACVPLGQGQVISPLPTNSSIISGQEGGISARRRQQGDAFLRPDGEDSASTYGRGGKSPCWTSCYWRIYCLK